MAHAAVVPELLAERAASRADQVFIACGGVGRTFGEMHERSERLASGLSEIGVRKGDRVATILPNRIEHVELIFACARIGALHVPVNVFLKGDFLSYQLRDAATSVVVADGAGLAAVEDVRDELPDVVHVLSCDDDLTSATPSVAADLLPSETMAVIYTSGTTGMPKGCMLPYGYHGPAIDQVNTLLEYAPGDVLYTALPLFHGWARGMLFASLVHGLTLHLDAEFSAATTVERWAETGATVFSGVGAMGMALLGQPPSELDREHRLRVAFMIPFAPDAEAAFSARFGPRVQSQMYGQTETGAISFTPLSEPGKPGTIGRPSPQYEVRIVDDSDNDVNQGDVGEVIVRPRDPSAMYTGYWRKPEETSEAMRGGWHHTGDLARADEDDFLTFVDRKKDALRRRGENIASVQLEAAIASHPKIAEAAVVAVRSEMTEDDIKACVVLNTGESITPDDLFAFFGEKLPYFAVPRYVEIVESLPKTATMRVQKHILRDAGVTDRTWDFEALDLRVAPDQRR